MVEALLMEIERAVELVVTWPADLKSREQEGS